MANLFIDEHGDRFRQDFYTVEEWYHSVRNSSRHRPIPADYWSIKILTKFSRSYIVHVIFSADLPSLQNAWNSRN